MPSANDPERSDETYGQRANDTLAFRIMAKLADYNLLDSRAVGELQYPSWDAIEYAERNRTS